MIHHRTWLVVAGHSTPLGPLKEVALLATDKSLPRTSQLRVEEAYVAEDLAPKGHIATTRYTPLREAAYVRAEVHRVGYGLLNVA